MNNSKKNKIKVDTLVPNPHIVGTSQYGLYLRFVKKKLLDELEISTREDEDNFTTKRSYIFNIQQLLTYLQKHALSTYDIRNIPIFWYSNGNHYGYEDLTADVNKVNASTNLSDFSNSVHADLEIDEHLYQHECVCRLSIPLTIDAGYIGRVPNVNILNDIELNDIECLHLVSGNLRLK